MNVCIASLFALHRGRLAWVLGLSLTLLVPGLAEAQSAAKDDEKIDKAEVLYSCGKTKGKVMVQFKPDVQLRELVAWAMGFSCKSFVYGSGVGGRSASANLIVPRSMNVEQAWRVFLVGLQSMGLAVVPRGKVLAIVEVNKARSGPLPLYLRSNPSRRVQIVRKLFRPRHTSADQLRDALELLKSKQGVVASLSEQGMVLVTDYADHIYRMSELVEQVDRPHDSETLYALKIRRVDAVELVKTLEELLDVGRSSKAVTQPPRKSRRGKKTAGTRRRAEAAANPARTAVPSKIIADPRTNTLLVVGSEAAYQRVRAVVSRIDIPIDGEASGSIHLYPLINADAEQLATTLQTLLSGRSAPAKSARPRLPTTAPPVEGAVQVAFDKPTNSLLLVASSRDYLTLSQIVRRLDEPRRQVYIEATVFEVSSSVERELGLSAHGGKNTKSGGLMIGGFQSGSVSSLSPAGLASLTGLVGGIFGKPLSGLLSGTSVPSFGVAVHALASNGYVDILSEPHILTADNKQAVVVGGQNIPYQSRLAALPSATEDAGPSFTTSQSVERKDLALTLKITPHISSDDLIRIDFELRKEDLLAESDPTLGPGWSTNQIKSSVVVKDQQTIVIGGLMTDRLEKQVEKVPFLGDLPVIGHLFQSTSTKKRKTNLLVLLTPHIIGDQRDARRILDRRMRERAEFMSSLDSLARAPHRRGLDYGRKRGLVEEINRTVAVIEREKELRRQLEKELLEPEDGPISTCVGLSGQVCVD